MMTQTAHTQTVSRSEGAGVRVGFNNPDDQRLSFDVPEFSANVDVAIASPALWAEFYSRMHKSWFINVNLGLLSSKEEQIAFENNTYVETSTIFAVLIGARYNFITRNLPGNLQMYVTGGAGPYWIPNISVKDRTSNELVSKSSGVDIGGYVGAGGNLSISDNVALTLDVKNHYYQFADNLDLQQLFRFNHIELGLGINYSWGKKRPLFEIQDVRLVVTDIYPAYYQFYSSFPLALVTVRNSANHTIEVKVRGGVSPYSPRMKDSDFVRIRRGGSKDIQVTAYFNPQVAQVESREPAVLEIEVIGRAGDTFSQELNRPIMVHNRNAWDGAMDKLGYFITPEDEGILSVSRDFIKSADPLPPGEAEKLYQAKVIFDALAKMDLQYQSDPNIPFYRDDRVQYAAETLQLKTGDCDDLVVLYTSMLESLGIHTAFVEVQDPEADIAHLYMMFDTGLAPAQGQLVSSNDKRYVVRENFSGRQSIWIPVETTLIQRGFEEAWKAGALQYLKEAITRNGLSDGWVRIINVG